MGLKIGHKTLTSRLLLGSAKYPSLDALRASILASETEILTVSLRREQANGGNSDIFWQLLSALNINILPNTAGCTSAEEAVRTAHLARSLFKTDWIKLEVIGCDDSLSPDPFGLVEAAKRLTNDGFTVLPYMTDDLVLAKRLLDVGCKVLMPWASPIGTGQGLANPNALKALRARFPEVTMIIDAGLGKPSDACKALELGFDGVLLNTAVAEADNPIKMAKAFALAVNAGRAGFEAGLMTPRHAAVSSTPLQGLPFHGL